MTILADFFASSDYLTDVGSNCSAWEDRQSGIVISQSTEATRPEIITNALGHKALRFAGSEFLQAALDSVLQYTTGDITMFVVLTPTGSAGTQFVIAKQAGGAVDAGYFLRRATTDRSAVKFANGSNRLGSVSANSSFPADTLQTIAGDKTGGSTRNNYIDGVSDNTTDDTTGAVSSITSTQLFTVGSLPNGTSGFVGDIHQIVMYDSLEDMSELHSAALAYWGVDAPEPEPSATTGVIQPVIPRAINRVLSRIF